jgi:hypothetical protein
MVLLIGLVLTMLILHETLESARMKQHGHDLGVFLQPVCKSVSAEDFDSTECDRLLSKELSEDSSWNVKGERALSQVRCFDQPQCGQWETPSLEPVTGTSPEAHNVGDSGGVNSLVNTPDAITPQHCPGPLTQQPSAKAGSSALIPAAETLISRGRSVAASSFLSDAQGRDSWIRKLRHLVLGGWREYQRVDIEESFGAFISSQSMYLTSPGALNNEHELERHVLSTHLPEKAMEMRAMLDSQKLMSQESETEGALEVDKAREQDATLGADSEAKACTEISVVGYPWYKSRTVLLCIFSYGLTALLYAGMDEGFPLFATAPLSSSECVHDHIQQTDCMKMRSVGTEPAACTPTSTLSSQFITHDSDTYWTQQVVMIIIWSPDMLSVNASLVLIKS